MTTEQSIRPARIREWGGFAFLCLLFIVITGWWVHTNLAPTGYDDSWYYTDSLNLLDMLTDHGLLAYLHQTMYVQASYKAPLYCMLPTPIYLLFGRNLHAAMTVNLCFIAVLLYSVFQISRRFWNTRTALLAVWVCGTLPILFGLSTWFLVEYGLAALVALAMWLLIASEDLTRTRYVLLFSAVCGLGMLQKIIFPAFLLAPTIFFFVRWVRRIASLPAGGDGKTEWPIKTLAALLIPIALIAGPWYLHNWHAAVARARFSAYDPAEAGLYSTGSDVFAADTLLRYGRKIINEGIGPAYFFAMLLALAALLAMRLIDRRRSDPAQMLPATLPVPPCRARLGAAALLMWFVGFGFFVFGLNKDVRFIAPLMPIFAITLGIAIDRLLARGRGWAVVPVGIMLAIPLGLQLQMMFHWPVRHVARREYWAIFEGGKHDVDHGRGLIFFASPKLGAGRVRNENSWPLQQTLLAALAAANTRVGGHIWVMSATDSDHFNSNNLQLAAVENHLPITVTTSAYYTDEAAMLDTISKMPIFIYRTEGESGNQGYNKLFSVAVNAVKTGPFEQVPNDIRFPDGGHLHIWRNLALLGGASRSMRTDSFIPVELRDLQECSIAFDGGARLTGISIHRGGDIVSLNLRWHCDSKIVTPFKFFGHVELGENQNVGWLDHDVLNEDPEMRQWRPGDTAIERKECVLDASARDHTVWLYMGLWDPGTELIAAVDVKDLKEADEWKYAADRKGVRIRIPASQPATRATTVPTR